MDVVVQIWTVTVNTPKNLFNSDWQYFEFDSLNFVQFMPSHVCYTHSWKFGETWYFLMFILSRSILKCAHVFKRVSILPRVACTWKCWKSAETWYLLPWSYQEVNNQGLWNNIIMLWNPYFHLLINHLFWNKSILYSKIKN